MFCLRSGIIEGSDDYNSLANIMGEVAECMQKKHGGLWDKFEFEFYGGGELPIWQVL